MLYLHGMPVVSDTYAKWCMKDMIDKMTVDNLRKCVTSNEEALLFQIIRAHWKEMATTEKNTTKGRPKQQDNEGLNATFRDVYIPELKRANQRRAAKLDGYNEHAEGWYKFIIEGCQRHFSVEQHGGRRSKRKKTSGSDAGNNDTPPPPPIGMHEQWDWTFGEPPTENGQEGVASGSTGEWEKQMKQWNENRKKLRTSTINGVNGMVHGGQGTVVINNCSL